jgi:hypothetical protein
MILGSLHMKLASLDPPVPACLLVFLPELGAFEVIGEVGADSGIALGGAGGEEDARQHWR